MSCGSFVVFKQQTMGLFPLCRWVAITFLLLARCSRFFFLSLSLCLFYLSLSSRILTLSPRLFLFTYLSSALSALSLLSLFLLFYSTNSSSSSSHFFLTHSHFSLSDRNLFFSSSSSRSSLSSSLYESQLNTVFSLSLHSLTQSLYKFDNLHTNWYKLRSLRETSWSARYRVEVSREPMMILKIVS